MNLSPHGQLAHQFTQQIILCKNLKIHSRVSRDVLLSATMFIITIISIFTTLSGYIVSHEWSDHGYVIHVNPLLNVQPEKDLIEPHEPLRENWRKDLQLLSDYLDYKVCVYLRINMRYFKFFV